MTLLSLAKDFTFFDASGIGNVRSRRNYENTEAVAKTSEPVVAPEVKATTEAIEETKEEAEYPYTPGYVTLDGISEQDAAVIMAITSFRTGIELERLAFKSIKRLNQDPVLENVSEQDAAVIMAITSDKTGIPLENLAFNSIKLVEE